MQGQNNYDGIHLRKRHGIAKTAFYVGMSFSWVTLSEPTTREYLAYFKPARDTQTEETLIMFNITYRKILFSIHSVAFKIHLKIYPRDLHAPLEFRDKMPRRSHPPPEIKEKFVFLFMLNL